MASRTRTDSETIPFRWDVSGAPQSEGRAVVIPVQLRGGNLRGRVSFPLSKLTKVTNSIRAAKMHACRMMDAVQLVGAAYPPEPAVPLGLVEGEPHFRMDYIDLGAQAEGPRIFVPVAVRTMPHIEVLVYFPVAGVDKLLDLMAEAAGQNYRDRAVQATLQAKEVQKGLAARGRVQVEADRSLTVESALRDRIQDKEYPPGEKLPSERALTQDLDTSRVALRLALSRLVADGTLVVGGRGFMVKALR